MKVQTICFDAGVLSLIDQRKIPISLEIFECRTFEEVTFAISEMVVRGAPAIGVAAAYGAYLAAKQFCAFPQGEFLEKLEEALDVLKSARPTAVNLMWAIEAARRTALLHAKSSNEEIARKLLETAKEIHRKDAETCHLLGAHGATLVEVGDTLLTHCNAGALAATEWGTALGVIRSAHEEGKDIFVYADETRPRLQGARLTAWELKEEGIPFKLIPDSVAAMLIRDGKIDKIFVGADRIAMNGDTANKIGTFMLSVVAKVYSVPFYVVAPLSTVDFSAQTGAEIEIEERSAEEVLEIEGVRFTPEDIEVYNPAFDVTPNENITGIVTEFGVLRPPFGAALAELERSVEK